MTKKFLARLGTGLAVAFIHASCAAEVQLLDTVLISSGKNDQHQILRNEVITTESFSLRDIEKSGATTLIEAVDKRPGISMQTECSKCNARNIVLNNLPGRYTTLLIDGIPIFSSVSTSYGLDSVSLGGVERIDVSRGAGTSLIAPEALSGAVNIVSRRPTENEFKASQQIGSYGQLITDIYAARAGEAGALTANFSHNQHDAVDGNDSKISDYSSYRRDLAGIGFFVNDLAGFKLRGRLDVVSEKRMGGPLGTDYAGVKADGSGNPYDWSKGPAGSPSSAGWINPASGLIIPYNGGQAGMAEIIFTDRQQFVSSATRALGDGTLRLAFGYAGHKQDSFYEKTVYQAEQTQYYLEASTQQPIADSLLTAGFSYRYEDLISHGRDAASINNDGIDNYAYRTPGIFLQAYRALLDDRLEINGALRLDHHNFFGNILSPRFNLLWNHDSELSSRFAIGKGFRAPTSFFEQDHGVLDTVRIERRISKPEISHNLSYALAYASDRLSWVGSINWNRLYNMAMLDPNQVDTAGNPITIFSSAPKPVTVFGSDLTLTYKITPLLEGSLGLEKTRYDFAPGTLAFARPTERAFFKLDYDLGPWDLMARASWTGSQDLARFYDYANNPRYNLDGSRKMDKSPGFWVVDLRGEYQLNKTWSLFAGSDNLFDYQQSKKDSYLWVSSSGKLDVTQIWGPNRGRVIYTGIKFSL